MAITIIQSPQDFTTIGNPMTFTLESDNYAQPNFMFVCDVYQGATLITKLKAFPNPSTNYGYFNIREILRFFIDIIPAFPMAKGLSARICGRLTRLNFPSNTPVLLQPLTTSLGRFIAVLLKR